MSVYRPRQMALTLPLYMLVQRAVAQLQAHAPADGSPYFGCFSRCRDVLAAHAAMGKPDCESIIREVEELFRP